MEDDPPKIPSNNMIACEPAQLRSKTFRLKLANSLRSQAERLAQRQGVSVSYLVTKAIEEKIARFRQHKEAHTGQDGVHLVVDPRKTT